MRLGFGQGAQVLLHLEEKLGKQGLLLVGNSSGQVVGKGFKEPAYLIDQLFSLGGEEEEAGTTVCGILLSFGKTLFFQAIKDSGHIGCTFLPDFTELILGEGRVFRDVFEEVKLLCRQVIGLEGLFRTEGHGLRSPVD